MTLWSLAWKCPLQGLGKAKGRGYVTLKIYRFLNTNTTQVIVHHNYCRGTKILRVPQFKLGALGEQKKYNKSSERDCDKRSEKWKAKNGWSKWRLLLGPRLLHCQFNSIFCFIKNLIWSLKHVNFYVYLVCSRSILVLHVLL